ncbi:MAG TPA: PEP-CTERM sorting domain-containing protein [Candidatus Sulfotelmatobacter sp.]|nr:PEP-CTERM sorting domain-containing protein [Candidatus Sulfotelmatobacter sp.]
MVLGLAVCAAGLSTVALLYLSPSLLHSSARRDKDIDRQVAEESRARLLRATEEAIRPHARSRRPVYPYSVVPGGVENARELKWAAEHDPTVAEHYAGFDYDHARVVRVALAQTVYVSYRIGNHVYWTRHRIALHKGEKLITDGKITARARCANRVEEVPQQLNSEIEPSAAKFDQPIAPRIVPDIMPNPGIAIAIPAVEFQSALLNRPGLGGIAPMPPLSLYSPFSGVNMVAIFSPPIPSGVCSPTKKPGKGEEFEVSGDTRKKKPVPCGSGGGDATTPEPATWLLLITGAAAIWWCARRRAIPVQS